MAPQRRFRFQSLLLFFAIISLMGCGPEKIFKDPPTSVATGLQFEDKIQGTALGGTVFINRAVDDSDASSYVLRWGSNGAPASTSDEFKSNYIGRVTIVASNNSIPYKYELYIPELPPEELNIDSIMVFTSNPAGENPIGIEVALNNLIEAPLAPTAHPQNVSFSDQNTRVTIQGNIEFVGAIDESNIHYYTLRYAGDDGCPLQTAAISQIPVGANYAYTISERTVISAARSVVVIAGNEHGEAVETDCALYSSSNTAEFNIITESQTPYWPARKVLIGEDTDDTEFVTALIEIQGSNDERDLSTGYYINLNDGTNGSCNTLLEFFPKKGKRQWHELQLDQWAVPTGATQFLVSTGTECGFEPHGQPHQIAIKNNIGQWFQIKTDAGKCLRAEDSEPTEFPDNDGQSSHLRLVDCDAYDEAQRFTRHTLDIGANEAFHRIVSVSKGGCIWRRDNTQTQEWQLMKSCNSGVGTVIRTATNGDNNKTFSLSIERDVSTDPEQPELEHSCAVVDGNKLISSWNNCNDANVVLVNLPRAGTENPDNYLSLY